MKFGIIVFPGSNCDHDCFYAVSSVLNQKARFIWHTEENIGDVDCVILPGGFSYGDYLRTGAIARFSPIMKSVIEFAGDGGLVMGICNGFQILTECGLLPGRLLKNTSLKFICKEVFIRVENATTPFTRGLQRGDVLRTAIAHGEGNYFIDEAGLSSLEKNNQIIFKYCGTDGGVSMQNNPNGSLENIAGICNRQGNVLGMMPHPERCSEGFWGNRDGRKIFESVIAGVNERPKSSITSSV